MKNERIAAATALVVRSRNVLAAYERGRAIGRALVAAPRIAPQPSAVARASVITHQKHGV
ncbi:MAG: hypothetical protein EON56_00015 [Alphaproteobacteria bacterium]|nr:MAG: hypothetical protein EON56_00015 [Alphaproteobacteria bacterium]